MKKLIIAVLFAVFFISCSNITDNQQAQAKQVTKPMQNTGGSSGGPTPPPPKP